MNAQKDKLPWKGMRWGLSRYSLAGALAGCGALAIVVVLTLGVGGSGSNHARASAKAAVGVSVPKAPSVPTAPSARKSTSAVSVGANGQVLANEIPDPEASKSFPAPASVHHKAAATPSKAAEVAVAPGAPSDAEVRRELNRMHAVEREARKQTLSTVPGGGSIGGSGTIAPPPGIPAVVARVIAGANAITDFPYVFGGGHASFVDNAYDCSGSVSYALAAGGLLAAPETSGALESWGAAGPGKWITVYANAGHTYMYVNLGGGWMRYDTSGRSGVFASRWQPAIRSNEGFVARHWPGL
jgi:cell wall-associated NlpC family hydrolase